MTCQEAQTGQQWGEGSRTTSSGLPRGSTWNQPPKLWLPPCLKKQPAGGSGVCGLGLQVALGFYQ